MSRSNLLPIVVELQHALGETSDDAIIRSVRSSGVVRMSGDKEPHGRN